MNKKIIRSLIIHMLVIWLIENINFVLPYVYRVHLHGNYLWKQDGTATTPWEYFLLLNYYPSNVYRLISKVLFFIPLTEFCYWFLFKRERIRLGVMTACCLGFIMAVIHHLPWSENAFYNQPFSIVQATITFAGYTIVYGFLRKSLNDRALVKEAARQRTENELNALKSQLNPHFFFNSINYIYGTALNEGAVKTADTISTLSEMMRYTITGVRQNFVPLKNELEFIRGLLSLQIARLPKKDSIKTHITEYQGNSLIAPMILLPFIENAFKYGTSVDYTCFIDLTIEVVNNKLEMSLKNRIITEHDEIAGNNTGILNARKRLELLYENNHSLEYGEAGEIYKVNLTINLNTKQA